MDHRAHEPGTVADCPDCQAFAIEPGWYKALRDERVRTGVPDSVLLPEAADEIVADPNALDVVLPDLEQTRPEDAS